MRRSQIPQSGHGTWWGMWPGLVAMGLAGSSVAVVSATQALPVLAVQSGRYVVAVIAVIAAARLCKVRLVPPGRRDIVPVIGGALSGLVAYNLATIIGTRHAEPALFGAAVACIPVALALIGPITERRRPSPRIVAGGLVVSAGAVLVTGCGRGDALGILMAASLIACEVASTLCGARALPRMGAWSYSAATAAVAAVIFACLIPVPGIERHGGHGSLPGLDAVAAIAYLGVIATAVAFVCWFTGLQRLGPSAVGLCAGSAAPASALIGALLGAPVPSVGAWIGMAVIALGLAAGFAPIGGSMPRRSRRMSNENVPAHR